MNKKFPLVSIITPVLDRKNTIDSAIKSVLGQTYRNIEYLIVDGGSTDGTIEVINKYREKISKFISEKDKGVYDGMNKGIRMASGEIIGILNSDDVYASDNVIEEVVKAMEESNADCCWGDLVYVDARDTNKIIRYWKSSEYEPGKFKKGWMPPHPTFFVRRWVYEKYGRFNLDFPISADYELMLRFLEKYKIKSCYIPQVMVKMRVGGQSNKSIINIIKANIECYKAWKINGLEVDFFRIFLKPLSKIRQYLKKVGY
ncbi:MAG: glycosyltransferase [Candidatus Aminicenantes bacterium]|nr:glycosyltransferase [Candidatus Aminicenantes bacterium]